MACFIFVTFLVASFAILCGAQTSSDQSSLRVTSGSSGFLTSFTSTAQSSSGSGIDALSVLVEAGESNATLNALSVLEAALIITSTSPVQPPSPTKIPTPITFVTIGGVTTVSSIKMVTSSPPPPPPTYTTMIITTIMTPPSGYIGLAKRDTCTSAGIEYACEPPTVTPMAGAPGQGCGSSSNSYGSTSDTIRAAAYAFCSMEFPNGETHFFRSGNAGPVASISAGDGNDITFQTQFDWLAVSTDAHFQRNAGTCLANFASAITLCDSADKPLLSGRRFDTEINGVSAHFTVAVLPSDSSSNPEARGLGKRDVNGVVGDTPNPINYITTTFTWVEDAQTVILEAFESDPATTLIFPGGTFTQTIYPTSISENPAPATTAT